MKYCKYSPDLSFKLNTSQVFNNFNKTGGTDLAKKAVPPKYIRLYWFFLMNFILISRLSPPEVYSFFPHKMNPLVMTGLPALSCHVLSITPSGIMANSIFFLSPFHLLFTPNLYQATTVLYLVLPTQPTIHPDCPLCEVAAI